MKRNTLAYHVALSLTTTLWQITLDKQKHNLNLRTYNITNCCVFRKPPTQGTLRLPLNDTQDYPEFPASLATRSLSGRVGDCRGRSKAHQLSLDYKYLYMLLL